MSIYPSIHPFSTALVLISNLDWLAAMSRATIDNIKSSINQIWMFSVCGRKPEKA